MSGARPTNPMRSILFLVFMAVWSSESLVGTDRKNRRPKATARDGDRRSAGPAGLAELAGWGRDRGPVDRSPDT